MLLARFYFSVFLPPHIISLLPVEFLSQGFAGGNGGGVTHIEIYMGQLKLVDSNIAKPMIGGDGNMLVHDMVPNASSRFMGWDRGETIQTNIWKSINELIIRLLALKKRGDFLN